jgi:serine O-acetyltransferase
MVDKVSCFELIKSDLFRYSGKSTIREFLKIYFINNAFKYQVFLRLCKSKIFFISSFAKLIRFLLSRRYSLHISDKIQIGYGLYIGHGTSVIVNNTAKIGNNCNLSQFTSIGSSSGKSAIIGDNVYIGPNVSIIGNVTIGESSIIGAGTVVTKNVPKQSVFAGNPGKVLSFDSSKHFYIQNPYVSTK